MYLHWRLRGLWGLGSTWRRLGRLGRLEETRENSKKLASEPPGGHWDLEKAALGATEAAERRLREPLGPRNDRSGSHWGFRKAAPGASEASERPLREPLGPRKGLR